MSRIVFATGNENKLREIRQIMKDLKVDIISMKEAGIDIDIEETGTSFEQNALITVRAIWEITGGIVMADDSGLVIDYLNGEPGVYSARYMGENTSYTEKNRKILERMADAKGEERSARFVAAIACILPDGKEIVAQETMEGLIAEEIAGENGFGYDPILYLPEYSCTSAQLSDEEKNSISHRGKALRLMREKLQNENISCQ